MNVVAPPPPLLRLEGISKSFGRVQSLRSVDLDIRAGEVLGLLGDNGAGKSTLIKILAGMQQPNGGKLLWNGEPQPSPHFDTAIAGRKAPAPDTASANFSINGKRRCSGMFGISS
jgi:ABC-type sugar transport system ATPase subunit